MTVKRRNYLLSQSNYLTTKFLFENILAIKIKKKTQILMNKPVYLSLSKLESSKTAIYVFWYDYVKPRYKEKAKLCYMDTGSLTYIYKYLHKNTHNNRKHLRRYCKRC